MGVTEDKQDNIVVQKIVKKNIVRREISEVFTNKKPIELFLKLDDNYVSEAIRTMELTYSHATKLAKEFVLAGLLMEKETKARTRKNILLMTEKGKELRDIFLKMGGVFRK